MDRIDSMIDYTISIPQQFLGKFDQLFDSGINSEIHPLKNVSSYIISAAVTLQLFQRIFQYVAD